MEIRIVKDSISRKELADMAREQFGDFVKAAVDIEQGIMAVGGELHMDEAVTLVELEGSKHERVWGVNLYCDKTGEEFVEFDSMVNLKPALGNRSRGVESEEVRAKIRGVINKLIAS